MTLSIIIPSFKDPCLHKTIESIIENAEGSFEIIPVCDGYIPKEPITADFRVRPIYLVENVGMREAINTGVKYSCGKYIMRTDEHCCFGKGFDSLILNTIQDDWIVTPRRFFLDPHKWEVMQLPAIDYEKLMIIKKPDGRTKFSAVAWKARTRDRRHVLIDENMAMQGSMWVMSRRWWDDVIGELDLAYGTHYQDSTEMLFKTWKAGGKLMLNKLTWYAHKHRSFNRTHNYPGHLADKTFKYALERHRQEYEEVRKKWGV
jgi:glycosyltransferase involved in cell wall biosynthesis